MVHYNSFARTDVSALPRKLPMKHFKNSKRSLAILISLAVFTSPAAVLAKDEAPKRSALLDELIECRKMTDSTEKLACYDEKVDQIDLAQRNNELIVADKTDIQEARKGLFGFSLPKIRLFGGSGDNDNDDIKEIESVVTSARQIGYGTWIIGPEDGSTWQQVGDRKLVLSPKSGNKVRIKKGAVTNYWANINGQRAISVKRIE